MVRDVPEAFLTEVSLNAPVPSLSMGVGFVPVGTPGIPPVCAVLSVLAVKKGRLSDGVGLARPFPYSQLSVAVSRVLFLKDSSTKAGVSNTPS